MVSVHAAPWGTRQRWLSAEPSCSGRLLFQEQREAGRALGLELKPQGGGAGVSNRKITLGDLGASDGAGHPIWPPLFLRRLGCPH